MDASDEEEFVNVPGLYRLWDLQFLFNRTDEFQVHYAELTEAGIPLFAVYRRAASVAGSRAAQ